MLKDHEQDQLRNALIEAFGEQPFDAMSIVLEAADNALLAAALISLIPGCRNKTGRQQFRSARIRAAVKRLKIPTDDMGYWHNTPSA
jgi:hypothetical protein